MRPPGRRRVLLALLLAGVLLGAAGLAWTVRRARALPPPPEVGTGVEPAVRSAVERMRQSVLEAPRSAEAWGRLAQVFLANELEEEATACAAVAQRLEPRNPRWPYYQALYHLNQGEREQALIHLRRAADLDEGEGGQVPRLLLAETLLGLGRLDEAESELKAVQQRQPQDVRLLYDLGLLAVARQDWSEARARLQRCLGSPHSRQKALVQLALVCLRLDDPAASRELRVQASRLPEDREWSNPFAEEYLAWAVKKRVRYRLADRLQGEGRFAEAAEVVRPLTEEYPDDYLTHMTLGKYLARAGRFQEAEAALRRAVRLAPERMQNHYYLSFFLLEQGKTLAARGDEAKALGRFREAEALARKALALKPDYGFAHMVRGVALGRLGRKAEALEALRQAVRCNPEHGELHYHLGVALAEAGQAAGARARLEQSLELAPGAAWAEAARRQLAGLAGEKGAKKPGSP